MDQRPFEDYRFMEQADKDFVVRLLFYDFLESADFNRKRKRGPQLIRTIIENDFKEHLRLQNYEACMVLSDMLKRYKIEIQIHDDII